MANNDEHLWRIAQQRLNSFDWELPVSKESIDTLHQQLPNREAEEPIQDWLSRALVEPNAINIIATSYITRHAAADGEISDYGRLVSDDHKFRLTVNRHNGSIYVKAEALGLVIEDYARRLLSITCQAQNQHDPVSIALNALAEGEITVTDNPENQQLFLSPDTRIIINVF